MNSLVIVILLRPYFYMTIAVFSATEAEERIAQTLTKNLSSETSMNRTIEAGGGRNVPEVKCLEGESRGGAPGRKSCHQKFTPNCKFYEIVK